MQGTLYSKKGFCGFSVTDACLREKDSIFYDSFCMTVYMSFRGQGPYLLDFFQKSREKP